MKFYPRLGIFKSSNGRNKFDGERAYSYDWYCYALKLPDGRFAVPSDSYSSTTAGHMSDWRRLIGHDVSVVRVTAPRGLTNTAAMREGIAAKQAALRGAMAVKGARKATNVNRAAAIEALEAELETVAIIEAMQTPRSAGERSETPVAERKVA